MMKTMLLILMTLASVAMADDAAMKKLLIGKWESDCTSETVVFQSDGKWQRNTNDTDPYWKWDIQKGELLEIWPDQGIARHSYTILFLTKHEFLAEANFGDGVNYIFLKRSGD